MKAYELADLLLQNPEQDVFITHLVHDDYGDSYYDSLEITGIDSTTPSGLFLSADPIKRSTNVLKPTDKPIIGSVRIKLHNCNDEYFTCESDYYGDISCLDDGWFWRELINEGYYSAYRSYAESIVFEHISTGIDHGDVTVYTPEDVEYVEVLTDLDENDWTCTWTKMTYKEAYDLFEKQWNSTEE